eukprot:5269799-Pyramimonas_sp.AAC.1
MEASMLEASDPVRGDHLRHTSHRPAHVYGRALLRLSLVPHSEEPRVVVQVMQMFVRSRALQVHQVHITLVGPFVQIRWSMLAPQAGDAQ